MNLKFFFVKKFDDYFKIPEKLFEEEIVKKNPELKNAIQLALSGNEVAKNLLYQQIVQNYHRKANQDTKLIYEGELFGETGIEGLKIDFNFGLRLDIPRGNFHARISDFETETIFFDEDVSDCRLISSENYFINWRVEIFHDGEKIFEHFFDVEKQNVLIVLVSSAVGDNLAILPHVIEFQKKYSCNLKIFAPKHLQDLIKNFYPEVQFAEKITQDFYATFYLAVILEQVNYLPFDGRLMPLEEVGRISLNLKNKPAPLKFSPTQERKIPEKYVCIAVQASGGHKGWLYPKGWEIVCDYLKNLGYRVLCIDKNKIEVDKKRGIKIQKPEGAENFCGNISLVERANMLYYADFFIGLSSGLAWLANVVGCPVIMIAGFSNDFHEFFTPYRVANRFVCNSCLHDIRQPIFINDLCPIHAGTERELECSKKISPQQVIFAIKNLIADKNLDVIK